MATTETKLINLALPAKKGKTIFILQVRKSTVLLFLRT